MRGGELCRYGEALQREMRDVRRKIDEYMMTEEIQGTISQGDDLRYVETRIRFGNIVAYRNRFIASSEDDRK